MITDGGIISQACEQMTHFCAAARPRRDSAEMAEKAANFILSLDAVCEGNQMR